MPRSSTSPPLPSSPTSSSASATSSNPDAAAAAAAHHASSSSPSSSSSPGSGAASPYAPESVLHKRPAAVVGVAPPTTAAPNPAPARFQLMSTKPFSHSPPSLSSSSSSTSTSSSSTLSSPASHKLLRRDHPTLAGQQHHNSTTTTTNGGAITSLSTSQLNKPNKLRKPAASVDASRAPVTGFGLAFDDPDEVVLMADDDPLLPGAPPPRSAIHNPAQPPPPPPVQMPTSATASALGTSTTTATTKPKRPEAVRQQSYSKRHASFDTPRTEVPLPFFSEPFPRELERQQQQQQQQLQQNQRRSTSDEIVKSTPPQPATAASTVPTTLPPSQSSVSQLPLRAPSPPPPLNRNNSAPTPPVSASPRAAPTDVHDLREVESLRDRVALEKERMMGGGVGAAVASSEAGSGFSNGDKRDEQGFGTVRRPPVIPSATTPPSSGEENGSVGRRSTASLPLPGEHAGEPLHRLTNGGAMLLPPSAMMSPLSAASGSGSGLEVRSFLSRAFVAPSPSPSLMLPPTEPQITTPPTTLHPLLDIPPTAATTTNTTPTHYPSLPSTMNPNVSSHPVQTSASAPPAYSMTSASSHAPTSASTSTSPSASYAPPPPAPSLSNNSSAAPTPSATTISTGPSGPHMTVQTTPTAYILTTYLPGYQRDEITLSTRKRRVLHVVADPFLTTATSTTNPYSNKFSAGCGHFERRISFGYDADMARVRAEFNGDVLKIVVPRRPTMSAPPASQYEIMRGGSAPGGSSHLWSTYTA